MEGGGKKRNIRKKVEDVEDEEHAPSIADAPPPAAKPATKATVSKAAAKSAVLLSFGADEDGEDTFVRAAVKPKKIAAVGVPFQFREGALERPRPESSVQAPAAGEYSAERLREVRDIFFTP